MYFSITTKDAVDACNILDFIKDIVF